LAVDWEQARPTAREGDGDDDKYKYHIDASLIVHVPLHSSLGDLGRRLRVMRGRSSASISLRSSLVPLFYFTLLISPLNHLFDSSNISGSEKLHFTSSTTHTCCCLKSTPLASSSSFLFRRSYRRYYVSSFHPSQPQPTRARLARLQLSTCRLPPLLELPLQTIHLSPSSYPSTAHLVASSYLSKISSRPSLLIRYVLSPRISCDEESSEL